MLNPFVLATEPAVSARSWRLQEAGYVLRDIGILQAFLTENDDLVSLLLEAWPVLKRTFGPDTVVSVQVVSDPESTLGRQDLLVTAHPRLPAEEALKALDRFDDEWWLEKLPGAKGRVVVSVESNV